MKRLALVLLSLTVLTAILRSEPAPPAAARDVVVKLATLVPDGSVWDKAFRKMGSDWKRETDGRVQLRIYPGGAAGDEPDILRKIRIGQLHAAALTVEGLSGIDSAFRIFEIPMFFASTAELTHVLEGIAPVFERRLRDKGFVLLHWGHAGWVHLFSTRSVQGPDDLKKLKQFVWAGDEGSARFWSDQGFQPVPLAATDIPMGLQTGMIEAVPAPPLSALAFQWFRSTPFMLDQGALPYLGATVITEKTWKKLSDEDQAKVLAACQRAEEYLAKEVPEQEREAIIEMKKRGVTVVEPLADRGPWQKIADSYAARLREEAIPEDVFDQVNKLRAEFRADGSSGDR